MLKSYLEIALQAAIKAGEAIMEVYGTNFSVIHKEDNSPLTIADENAHAIIVENLKMTELPIISEESKQDHYELRKNWQRCWIVDPLDGTKEFVQRNGEFTVNIALIEGGVPLLGVIYIPVLQKLYFTSENGSSAYKLKIDTNNEFTMDEMMSKRQQILPVTPINFLNIVSSRSHYNDHTRLYVDSLRNKYQVTVTTKGSSIKFCSIAEGEAHIYPRFAPTMEWDTAAGHAICKAVGVEVVDQETQQPLVYNKKSLLNSYFVASSI